jgi:iron complex transport system ATP-binding protein
MTTKGAGAAVPAVLAARGVTLAYEDAVVATALDLDIVEGTVTAVIGPNGSGKSTLLRALARLLPVREGVVLLDGTDIRDRPTREVARRLGLLPQSPPLSVSITVEELVGRGRYPHRRWFEAWSKDDERAVEEALAMAHLVELRRRPVDRLSGGQRQRVWIAMALAQQSPVMLLDEPTTHLDMAHRLEVLDLLAALNRDLGRTVVMVMHELDEAARYADRLVAMRDGRIVASGPPAEVVTADMVEAVFGVRCRIVDDPFTGRPRCVPAPAVVAL